jgi:hypothetical protein
MNWYIQFVTTYPISSAMLQFAVLGTFGEIISRWIQRKKVFYPFNLVTTVWKMISWSILAVCIKYAFVGTEGYLDALVYHQPHAFLPLVFKDSTFLHALTKSILVNLQFGLFLVIFHRILDNLIVRQKNWGHLDKAMITLVWFWIPAHTVTFILPIDYQIGLAALWSVVLGMILGTFMAKPSSKRNKIKKKMVLANYF